MRSWPLIDGSDRFAPMVVPKRTKQINRNPRVALNLFPWQQRVPNIQSLLFPLCELGG
jgi:hypothetical protein